MKKLLLILSIIVSCLHPAYTQNWQVAATAKGVTEYQAVQFWDNDSGIIADWTGRFFITNNGGSSWTSIKPYYLDTLKDHINDMQFLDGNRGFACGGSSSSAIKSMLLTTTDGGFTWDSLKINSSLGGDPYYGLNFSDSAGIRGILWYSADLYKTLDTGKTISYLSQPANVLIDDAVLTGTKIIIAGRISSSSYRIYTSTDMGANWAQSFNGNVMVNSLGISGTNVLAGGALGWIVRSTDGGNNWTKSKIASDYVSFYHPIYGKNGYVYMVGMLDSSGIKQQFLYGSADNGQTWTRSLIDSGLNTFMGIAVPSKDTAYAISFGKVYKTTNGAGLNLKITDLSSTENSIMLYPNPGHNTLFIKTDGVLKIESVVVYDIAGKMIYTQNGATPIDVSRFLKGEYIIELTTDKGEVKKKLLVY